MFAQAFCSRLRRYLARFWATLVAVPATPPTPGHLGVRVDRVAEHDVEVVRLRLDPAPDAEVVPVRSGRARKRGGVLISGDGEADGLARAGGWRGVECPRRAAPASRHAPAVLVFAARLQALDLELQRQVVLLLGLGLELLRRTGRSQRPNPFFFLSWSSAVPDLFALAQRIAEFEVTSPDETPREKPLGAASAAGESASRQAEAAVRESAIASLGLITATYPWYAGSITWA